MMETLKGRIHIFGDNIDTDQIYPGRFLELVKPEEIASHCLEGADPGFAERIKEGDIIVAGTNFGCGSSREHAAIALKSAGIGLIVAESFARIFYRNAINLALPVLVCRDIAENAFEGDILLANLKTGEILNETRGISLHGEGLSDYVMNILESGGIKPLFKNRGSGKAENIKAT